MTKQLKNVFIVAFVVVAVAVFFWVAKKFGSGESVESESPLVICQPQDALPERQKCFWTAHLHFHLNVYRGEAEIPLGFEQGVLEGMHTHAEQQKIHWHGLIPVDPKTKELTNRASLRVENITQDLKLSLEGTPRYFANGKEVGPSYIWQDGEHIEVRFEK